MLRVVFVDLIDSQILNVHCVVNYRGGVRLLSRLEGLYRSESTGPGYGVWTNFVLLLLGKVLDQATYASSVNKIINVWWLCATLFNWIFLWLYKADTSWCFLQLILLDFRVQWKIKDCV